MGKYDREMFFSKMEAASPYLCRLLNVGRVEKL